MKKKWFSKGTSFCPSQLLLIMKMALLFFVFGIMGVSAVNSYSQTAKLTLNFSDVSIEDALNEIENQSDFYFVYNKNILKETSHVSLNVENQKISEVLDLLFKGSNVKYKVMDKYIIISSSDSQEEQSPEYKISGKVLDSGKTPLPGATVVVKGTTIGTITDMDGKYTLAGIPADAILQFSFIGMKSFETTVAGKSIINVTMQDESIGIDEVVAIGYGSVKRSDLTGSVMRMDAEKFKNQPMTQISDMLTGTVAGFNATQETSAAGGSSMQIRGRNSLSAVADPLIVLDGVIYNGEVSDIMPSDIESLDILKDASSCAVFGSRAAAGVIIINTKKGKKGGAPKINFSFQVGGAEAANDLKPFDAEGYLKYRRDVLTTWNSTEMGGTQPTYFYDNPDNISDGASLSDWRNATANPQSDNTLEYLSRLNFYPTEIKNYLAGKTTDWYDKVMQMGLRQNYDVSISGGSDTFTYYWSMGSTKNEGVVIGDDFGTIRTRLNLDAKIADWFHVGMNTQFSARDESSVTAKMSDMYVCSPYGDMYNEDGSVKWYPHDYAVARNPLLDYYGKDQNKKTDTFFSSIYAKIDLPFGFAYKLSVQPRMTFGKDHDFWSSDTETGGVSYEDGYGTRTETSSFENITDNLLTWNKKFGIHSFDLTLLYSIEESKYWSSFQSNQTFSPNQLLGYHGLQYGSSPSITDNDTKVTGDAAMARLNYSLNDKYLITASVRRDGYSAFGQDNPRAVFPAVALAWRLSEEDFFNVSWINRMKLRLSWGVNGNREIGAYSALASVSRQSYYTGTSTLVGTYADSMENSNLSWERTESLNMGIDAGLWDGRIDVSAEYYNTNTTDLLMDRKLPEITGFSSITTNLGKVGNQGFEFTMNTVNVKTSNFTWNSTLVFSLNRNKIKKLFGDYDENGNELADYTNKWFPGQAIDRIWDYDIKGVFQLDEATDASVYHLTPGDYKVDDVNDDGVYSAMSDKKFIGYTEPRYRIGFRNDISFLKNFTASIFLRAELGKKTNFTEALHKNGSEMYDRLNSVDIPYWSPDNPINDYGSLKLNTSAYGGGLGMYMPSSFLRIQDVSVSYNLPQKYLQLMRLSSLRVYSSVRNLYCFTNWPGWDPESIDSPMPRILTFGINLSL